MHTSDVFVENFKRIEICDKLWQQCVYFNNLLTKILAWQAILYQRGINIVGHNHFWRCGPRPKTSRKTSHFLLNDAMFQRCFEKNIDFDVFDDVWKNTKHRINDASNDVNRPPLCTNVGINVRSSGISATASLSMNGEGEYSIGHWGLPAPYWCSCLIIQSLIFTRPQSWRCW